jgi:glycosyltransferase involved in cell wall biosynthesis
LWQRKQKAWEGLDLTIVGPSRWICDLAGRSSLFHDRRIEHIPTGVNLDVFKPRPKEQARSELGIPLGRKVVAFGAGNVGEKRKGIHFLKESLGIIANTNIRGIHLLMFGQGSEAITGLPFPSTSVGQIDDDNRLSVVYSAADCFVAPSLEENMANTCLEAMSCGVPLVAFDVGGMPDLIEHKKTGYLSRPTDGSSLAEGICWVLHTNKPSNQLSLTARHKAEQKFSLRNQALRFQQLLKQIPIVSQPHSPPSK